MTSRIRRRQTLLVSVVAVLWWSGAILQGQPGRAPNTPTTAPTVLFIGNSFTYGGGSPVQFYRPNTVTDLNGTAIGGVPALFKAFASEAGRDMKVYLETAGGRNLDYHLENKVHLIARPWDYVLLQGYSLLDKDKPGDPAVLVRSTKALAEMLSAKNPNVDIHLVATWSRADQTYPESGHWHGQPIESMALDVRRGYDLAAAASTPTVRGVVPVGEAWNRAIRMGIADPNPYDGVTAGQLGLWADDHYHASSYGYYLEALMVFCCLTGLDPRSLGKNERAGRELGFSPEQTRALQQVAFDELTANRTGPSLRSFEPVLESTPIVVRRTARPLKVRELGDLSNTHERRSPVSSNPVETCVSTIRCNSVETCVSTIRSTIRFGDSGEIAGILERRIRSWISLALI